MRSIRTETCCIHRDEHRSHKAGDAKAATVALVLLAGRLWAIAAAPFYVLWKLLMLPRVLRSARGGHSWVRTRQNAEVQVAERGTTVEATSKS